MTRADTREIERQLAEMRDGASQFYGEDELRERLATVLRDGRPLRVKLGMDPSAPDLHLGHTVVLSKLARFQALGHTAIFLIGDFTARIGDPSGRKKTRPALSPDEVRKNAETYVDQVRSILDADRAEVRFNSEWMDRMSPGDFVRLCSKSTVARLLERDDFANRHAAGEPISMHEFLYPFVQAYDSVALESDVELGGTDQTFNLLMAREVQRDYGQPPQAVITHPLLVGTDGRDKMSKSLGNAVGISDAPEEMFGQVMSISDELMGDWYDRLHGGAWPDLAALRPDLGRKGADPLAFKQTLADHVVARFHGAEAAERARDHFEQVFRRKETPDDVPEIDLAGGRDGGGLLSIMVRAGLAKSNSEARRLVSQNAVKVDGVAAVDATLRLSGPGPYLIQVGKRRFARVRLT